MTFEEPPPVKIPVKKTRSYDARLHHAVELQEQLTPRSGTPQPRRKRIGSLEGIFKVAKKAFRRQSEASGPRRVRGVYDVSTTSSIKTSDEVLQEMERVLQQMNVDYKRKG